jgi:uncharacterized membrane protein
MGISGEAGLLACLRRFLELAAPSAANDCWVEPLLTHPAYPNVRSILDAVRVAGLQCAVVHADLTSLSQLSKPSLLYRGSGRFTVLEDVSPTQALLTDETDGRRWVAHCDLGVSWTGIAIVVERITSPDLANDCSGERKELGPVVARALLVFAAGAVTLGSHNWGGAAPAAMFVLHILGAWIALALAGNAANSGVLRALCHASSDLDCRQLLQSRQGTFLGISLASWAATYFMSGSIAFAAALIVNAPVLRVFAWIAVLAVPIIAGSIVVQAAARTWCGGCLAIDAILLAQTAIAWPHRGPINLTAVRLTAAAFCLAAIGVTARQSAVRPDDHTRRRYLRLKRDPAVLASLLERVSPMHLPPCPAALSIGSDDALIMLTLVTSPYCPACADAHDVLLALTESGAVRVRLVFPGPLEEATAGGQTLVVAHALMCLGRVSEAHAVLRSWFAANGRSVFDERKLKDQRRGLSHEALHCGRAALAKQGAWCATAGFDATPVVLLNGRPLSPHYSVRDLSTVDMQAVGRIMAGWDPAC